MSQSFFSTSYNKSFKRFIFSARPCIERKIVFALFLPLLLLLSGPYLQHAQSLHYAKRGVGSNKQSEAENPYLTQKEGELVVLHSRHLTPRRRGGVLCPTSSEEVENEEVAVKKKQPDDEHFYPGCGLYKSLYLIAFDFFCGSLKKHFAFQEHFPDQYSNKRYILIQVFRI